MSYYAHTIQTNTPFVPVAKKTVMKIRLSYDYESGKDGDFTTHTTEIDLGGGATIDHVGVRLISFLEATGFSSDTIRKVIQVEGYNVPYKRLEAPKKAKKKKSKAK